MHKYFILLVFVLLSICYAKGDDGWAIEVAGWTYGNVYTTTPNEQIALDKELMAVLDGDVEAQFVFRNTTDSAVTVNCAFPRYYATSFSMHDDTVWIDNDDLYLWEWAFDKPLDVDSVIRFELDYDLEEDVECFAKYFLIEKDSLLSIDKQLRIENLNKNVRDISIDISQDSKRVRIDKVGIETTIDCIDCETSFLRLVVHYSHQLIFQPEQTSVIDVSYCNTETIGRWNGGRDHSIYYNISTGGTWKNGEIGSFVLITDYDFIKDNDFDKVSVFDKNIYSKKNYVPKKGETFRFVCNESFMYDKYYFPYKKGKSTIVENVILSDVDNDQQTDPENAFDGNISTFWKSVDTQSLSFTLKCKAFGPFVASGAVTVQNDSIIFSKYGKYEVESGDFDEKILLQDKDWKLYGRPRIISLKNNKTNTTKEFKLIDRYPADVYYCNVDSKEFDYSWRDANNTCNIQLFDADDYMLTINKLYDGTLYKNAAISEIWFYPLSQTLESIIENEKNDSIKLFDKLNSYFNKDNNYRVGLPPIDIPTDDVYIFGSDYKPSAKNTEQQTNNKLLWYIIGCISLLVVAIVIFIFRRKTKNK